MPGRGTDPGEPKDKLLVTKFFFLLLRSRETSGPGGRHAPRVLGFLQLLSSSSNKGYSPCFTLFVSSDRDSCSSDANAHLRSWDCSGSALPGPLPPLLLLKG